MSRSPREIVEQVRRMVAGEDVALADLFAADGVLAYPFAPPGQPRELRGRDAIRAYHDVPQRRELLAIEGVDVVVRDTNDPEVVVAEITHHGRSRVADAPYRITALGVIRVHHGEIVRYDDYMDPIAIARLLGRTDDLVAALTTA